MIAAATLGLGKREDSSEILVLLDDADKLNLTNTRNQNGKEFKTLEKVTEKDKESALDAKSVKSHQRMKDL